MLPPRQMLEDATLYPMRRGRRAIPTVATAAASRLVSTVPTPRAQAPLLPDEEVPRETAALPSDGEVSRESPPLSPDRGVPRIPSPLPPNSAGISTAPPAHGEIPRLSPRVYAPLLPNRRGAGTQAASRAPLLPEEPAQEKRGSRTTARTQTERHDHRIGRPHGDLRPRRRALPSLRHYG